jgi:hypothetical protein
MTDGIPVLAPGPEEAAACAAAGAAAKSVATSNADSGIADRRTSLRARLMTPAF